MANEYWSNCSNLVANGTCRLYTGSGHTTPVDNGYYSLGSGTYYRVTGGAGLITEVATCPLPPSAPFQIQAGSGGTTFQYTSSIDNTIQNVSLLPGASPIVVCVKCGTTPRKTSGNGTTQPSPGGCSQYPVCP